MSLIIDNKPEQKTDEKREAPIKEGIYDARCIALVDLGKQEDNFDPNNIQWRTKIWLEFEIPGEPDPKNGLPHKVSISNFGWTLSFHEKSKLLPEINKWRGEDIEEGDNFQLPEFIKEDIPCRVKVIDNNGYNEVTKIMAAKNEVPAREAPPLIFDINDDLNNQELLDHIPPFIRKIIFKSKEGSEYRKKLEHEGEFDGDIPF